jgi:hypothetical protein
MSPHRIANSLIYAAAALVIGLPSCGGVSSEHDASASAGTAGAGASGTSNLGGSTGAADVGGSAGADGVTAGTGACNIPEVPVNDSRCPTEPGSSLPHEGSACDSPGLKCFGLQGTGVNWCAQPPYVASSLCCENGWLGDGVDQCPVPITGQDPLCPPPIPSLGATCQGNLLCQYESADAQRTLSSFCCANGGWVGLGGPNPSCPPPP